MGTYLSSPEWVGVFIVLGSTICATVVAHVRHEGRLNGHDSLFTERDRFYTQQFVTLEKRANERHDELIDLVKKLDEKTERHATETRQLLASAGVHRDR